MKTLKKTLLRTEPVSQLMAGLRGDRPEIYLTHLAGSLGVILAALMQEELESPLLLIMPSPSQAEGALDDLNVLLGSERVSHLPPAHLHPFEVSPLASGPRNERVDTLLRLGSGRAAVVVTQPEALLEDGPDSDWLELYTCKLKVGQRYSRQTLLADISGAGYIRENLVNDQGQYAVRGGLIDLFPYGHEYPVRIEFDDDGVASLRRFDPVTQRTVEVLKELVILIGDDNQAAGGGIFKLLPPETLIYWSDLYEIEGRIERFRERVGEAKRQGIGRSYINPAFSDAKLSEIRSQSKKFRQVIWSGLITGRGDAINFRARTPDPFAAAFEELPAYLKRYNSNLQVCIATDNEGERKRLEEFLIESDLDEIRTLAPTLTGGFVSPALGIAALTSHELFNRRRMRAHHTRFRRRGVQFDRSSLRVGDLVVHANYGIGRYEGLQTVNVHLQPRECLRICYKDNVILYIPVENFGLVEKYIGSEGARPNLSKIGGSEWARTKKKTKKALQDMSQELLRLYAARKTVRGHAYPLDTHWQREMEASFEFQDTPDQAVASEEIKKDLEAPFPMDRLLCGDVGFGKTEVAVRAAFKVVQDSYQVAVLAPTTVLAQQHHETFCERLAAYPVQVEVLSRFRSPAEQKEVISQLKEGKVDIVIGTHRLLSRDVGFNNLGLLIIDEEHRFGVRHKERLKQLKTNVEALTMSATPIPRTLHLALMGARDTSQINTPPVDRLSIQTEVHPWNEEVIKYAILREVDRQGQVFFVHNRIQSIPAVQGMLERLAPGLRYAVAHGRMKERELEKVMFGFTHGKYDVLVTTMIIESGLDIPNANTLIVNRADRFGLAQLYQLRGRIGRSSRQAYAYLLTPPRLVMTLEARKRLSTLTELTDLGSGMKVAMRDLEIRGAGNLLGAEQSGHINAIGFDLYTKMLEETVREVKGGAEETLSVDEWEIKIDFDGPALLPAGYIDDSDLRYFFYRKLAEAKNLEAIDRIQEELTDRFGNLPIPARNLLDVARLKLLSRLARFNRLNVAKKSLTAALSLPPDPADGQRYIGNLVLRADPETVEFRMIQNPEMIYRLNSPDYLKQACLFLRHVTREGILLG
ncbi:MAG: transcription-repair coupling factor [Calditrichota bacterium]